MIYSYRRGVISPFAEQRAVRMVCFTEVINLSETSSLSSDISIIIQTTTEFTNSETAGEMN
jgi:hypothetical protein